MIIDMSIIEDQLVQILINSVKNYDAIYSGALRMGSPSVKARQDREKAKNYGITNEDIIVSIVFDDDSAPVGLSRATRMDKTAKLTIDACKAKDPSLLPALLQHKNTGAVFAVGIGCKSFCIFNISGDFSVVHEVEVCRS